MGTHIIALKGTGDMQSLSQQSDIFDTFIRNLIGEHTVDRLTSVGILAAHQRPDAAPKKIIV